MKSDPIALITVKRDGKKLTQQQIKDFVVGATEGWIANYQVSAFLMATYLNGMDEQETAWLTQAMIQGGKSIHFDQSLPIVDKHSTGGVGDKVSMIIAPIAAVYGVYVPMVAGRGLGHTGGTIDKLESIPGFKTQLSIDRFKQMVLKNGLSIMSQSDEFVPADKLFYALRDVTGTISCIPLIVSSILSKKASEGIKGLVLDIKVGSGAFMKNIKDAEKLAKICVRVGKKLGLKVHVLISDMNQPLGFAVGNSLEILECLDVLSGKGPTDLKELSIEIAAHMLLLGCQSSSLSSARIMAKQCIQSGQAHEKFLQFCKDQGASEDFLKDPQKYLSVSKEFFELSSKKSGYITKINTFELGMLSTRLGAGRLKADDKIHHGVGFKIHVKLGDLVKTKGSLITVYFDSTLLKKIDTNIEELKQKFLNCFEISNKKSQTINIIKKVIRS